MKFVFELVRDLIMFFDLFNFTSKLILLFDSQVKCSCNLISYFLMKVNKLLEFVLGFFLNITPLKFFVVIAHLDRK